MTEFKSKKTAALDEEGMYLVHHTAQEPMQKLWDTPSEKFNNWWNAEYDDSANPFEIDTFAYWAWAGWQAALAQPAQGLVQKPAAVVSSCTGAGDKGVRVKWLGGFPQIGDRLYTAPPQRPWVDLTDEEISEIAINNPPMVHEFARAVLAKSKEKNK